MYLFLFSLIWNPTFVFFYLSSLNFRAIFFSIFFFFWCVANLSYKGFHGHFHYRSRLKCCLLLSLLCRVERHWGKIIHEEIITKWRSWLNEHFNLSLITLGAKTRLDNFWIFTCQINYVLMLSSSLQSYKWILIANNNIKLAFWKRKRKKYWILQ